jgi:DNA (cytosine-5)-methyltransferase 1
MPDKERLFAVLQPTAFRWQNDRDGLQQDDAVAALRASAGSSGFHEMNHPVIAQPVPYDLFQITAPVNRQNRQPGDPCHTLARDNAAHAAIAIQGNLVGRETGGPQGVGASTDGAMYTLTKADTHAVAFTPGNLARGAGASPNAEVSQTLQSQQGRGATDQHPCVAFDWQSGGDSRGLDPKDTAQLQRCQTPAVHHAMTVRRLTPVECERLQGFPDNWTAIPWRKKPAEECPDGPRYKALGNSMACNCMALIGERIAAYEQRGRVDPTPAGTAGIAPAGDLNHEGDRHG